MKSCWSSIFSEHPHPASSLRELADLPTWWGGELREFDLYRTSPPGGLAARARRPPHTVGRRATRVRSLANIPTRRARCASAPTSPHGGEASYASSTSPHGGEATLREFSGFSDTPRTFDRHRDGQPTESRMELTRCHR